MEFEVFRWDHLVPARWALGLRPARALRLHHRVQLHGSRRRASSQIRVVGTKIARMGSRLRFLAVQHLTDIDYAFLLCLRHINRRLLKKLLDEIEHLSLLHGAGVVLIENGEYVFKELFRELADRANAVQSVDDQLLGLGLVEGA